MEPGTVLGAYRVVKQIGAGGMGQVFIAEHTMLGRRAALKILHPQMSARQDIVRRFFNEARAATTIPDPGIVQVFDFGYHDDGSAYIVMELLDGEALERRISRGRLDLAQALRLMRQVASTLGAAHERGIVHRDLKPDNIFIVRDPEVAGGERAKILDFGIAKLADERRTGMFDISAPHGQRNTASGILGTPLYMSPEQCQAEVVDARSDVYALGCVLFQMLTGRYAFDAETAEMLIFQHVAGPIPVTSTFAPDIPRAIDEIVTRCLAKQPRDRFASGTELAQAIAEVAVRSTEPPAIVQARAASAATIEAHLDDELSMATVRRASSPLVTQAPNPKKMTTLSRANGSITTPSSTGRSVAIGAVAIVGAASIGAVAWFAVRGTQGGEPTGVAASPEATAPATAPAETTAVVMPMVEAPADAAALDTDAVLADRMREVLTRFARWAPDHAGAPCPDILALGPAVLDPWNQPLSLTCTDQPQNQIIGVVSPGPDATAGTADDVGSWQLARTVTDLAFGTRWTVAAPVTPAVTAVAKPEPVVKTKPRETSGKKQTTKTTKTTTAKTTTKATTPTTTKSTPTTSTPGIVLDENGVPVHR
jgi:serine/threonine protein kinase